MRATKANRVKFVQSSVDESLFGERVTAVHEPLDVRTFDPPWEDNGKAKASPSKPLLFYCPTSPSWPTFSRSQTSQASPVRSYKPVKFSPSYVDDSLFGKRKTKRSDSPPPSEFEPPWVKESEKRPVRPLLFDFKARLVFEKFWCKQRKHPGSICTFQDSIKFESQFVTKKLKDTKRWKFR